MTGISFSRAWLFPSKNPWKSKVSYWPPIKKSWAIKWRKKIVKCHLWNLTFLFEFFFLLWKVCFAVTKRVLQHKKVLSEFMKSSLQLCQCLTSLIWFITWLHHGQKDSFKVRYFFDNFFHTKYLYYNILRLLTRAQKATFLQILHQLSAINTQFNVFGLIRAVP